MVAPVPHGWRPQAWFAVHFPAIIQLCQATEPEIRALEAVLDRDEAAGRNTAGLRQAISELHWRLQYTGDPVAATQTLERVRALAGAGQRATPGPVRDELGSFGIGTGVWFLKLDASVDPMLDDAFDPSGVPPRFLDRVNDPQRLDDYLYSLLVSRLGEDGVDHRKELNFATSSLVRLILRRRPRGYPWDTRLDAVIRRFIADWQDPRTGFFGADYDTDGQRWRTVDLSLTFHMARYLEGRIGHWQELIDTLLRIRDDRYPNGWLDDAGMTSHNNYDVAMLFALGWPQMRPDQRRAAQRELDRMLRWCLDTAIAPDGAIVARAVGESLPESYYFAVAFLDTVGFFSPVKRFWTDREFPQAAALRARLESRIRELHPGVAMARMALARLRR